MLTGGSGDGGGDGLCDNDGDDEGVRPQRRHGEDAGRAPPDEGQRYRADAKHLESKEGQEAGRRRNGVPQQGRHAIRAAGIGRRIATERLRQRAQGDQQYFEQMVSSQCREIGGGLGRGVCVCPMVKLWILCLQTRSR